MNVFSLTMQDSNLSSCLERESEKWGGSKQISHENNGIFIDSILDKSTVLTDNNMPDKCLVSVGFTGWKCLVLVSY